MTIAYILTSALLILVVYRMIKPLRTKNEKPKETMSYIQDHFKAQMTEASLANFNTYKLLTSPRIIRSIRINKGNDFLDIVFVEYKYVVPNAIRWSPPDDISTYAFYLFRADTFNIGDYQKIDTQEIINETILIRFDKEPISKIKTTKEINTILTNLKSFS